MNADLYADTGNGLIGTNVFAYCDNKPTNHKDPSGEVSVPSMKDVKKGYGVVYVATAKAWGIYHHACIIIFVPYGHQYFNDSRFSGNNCFPDGKWYKYATIGGWPGPYNGKYNLLVSHINRKEDIDLNEKTSYTRQSVSIGPLIARLFLLEFIFKYNSKNPRYSMAANIFKGGYNCNSFARGLLKAAGLKPKMPLVNVIGWGRPLPKKYFAF